jgi:hypothetical protein
MISLIKGEIRIMTSKRTIFLLLVVIGILILGTTIASATHSSPYIDLTTFDALVTHNGAQFVQSGSGAGTGNWNPFLTFNVGGSDPDEQGYNTSPPANCEYDAFCGGHNRTHAIQLAAIPTVEIGGVVYREFGLDSNDSGSDDYMSIDEFKLFIDEQGDLTGYDNGSEDFSSDIGPTADKVFDMDDNCGASPEGCTVFMRSQALSAGSGVSDIIIRVPDSAFDVEDCEYGSLTCGQYVYLWSSMGYYADGDPVEGDQDWNTNAGFEEWQIREAPVVNVDKTADTSYTQDYEWMVDKKVKVDGTCEDSASVDLFTGESQDAEWCIDVTRTLGDQSDQTVFGTITIFNPTDSDVIPDDIEAEITSIEDEITLDGSGPFDVTIECDGAPYSPPYTLDGGETLECTYSYDATGATNTSTGSNDVTVTVTDAGTLFEASAPFDFADTADENITETNASATLTDDLGSLDKLFTGSGSESYTATYTCDTDEGLKENTAVITPSDGGPADQDAASLDIDCYQIDVTKDASTSLTRTYQWTIEKSASPDWQLFTGESGTSAYVVTVDLDDPAYVDSEWAVEGNITVSNVGNPIPATINNVTDEVSPDIAATVVCDETLPYTIPAGGTLDCTYSSDLTDAATRTNTATATQQLYDYDVDGVGTADGTSTEDGTAAVSFANPTVTEVDATINVEDSFEGGPASNIGSCSEGEAPCVFEIPHTFTCDADEGSHDNEAKIVETGLTATASVTVDCYNLEVTKTAEESFTRTYKWTIDKVVDDPGPIQVLPGESVTVNYDVTVGLDTPPYEDSDWAVEGVITINNYHPSRAADLTGVVDEIEGVGSVSVDCSGVTTVPAGGSIDCTYSSSLPDAASRLNTATATQQLYNFDEFENPTSDGTMPYSGFETIDFAGADMTEKDDMVDVYDDYAGFLGTMHRSDAPKVFEYSRVISAPDAFCGEFTVDNEAWFITNDTGATDSAFAYVDIEVPCEGCTPGFWQGGSGSVLWDDDSVFDGGTGDPQWPGVLPQPFSDDTYFNDFFTPHNNLSGLTMYDLVSSGGGSDPVQKAARDLVAAYLNESAFPGTFPADSLLALETDWNAAVTAALSDDYSLLDAFHVEKGGWNNPEGGYCPLP